MEKIKEYWWAVLIVLFFVWFLNKSEPKSEDYWCNYLSEKEASYCHNLYDKVAKMQSERADYEESQGRSGEYDPRL